MRGGPPPTILSASRVDEGVVNISRPGHPIATASHGGVALELGAYVIIFGQSHERLGDIPK